METLTKKDAINMIIEQEENAGYGQDDMPKLTSRTKLMNMNNKKLLALLEDMTTNYGTYQIVE